MNSETREFIRHYARDRALSNAVLAYTRMLLRSTPPPNDRQQPVGAHVVAAVRRWCEDSRYGTPHMRKVLGDLAKAVGDFDAVDVWEVDEDARYMVNDEDVAPGERLYRTHAEPLLGPWQAQPVQAQAAWADLADRVERLTFMAEYAGHLAEPPPGTGRG